MSERKARFSVIKSKDGQQREELTHDVCRHCINQFWDLVSDLKKGESIELRDNYKEIRIFYVEQPPPITLEEKIDLRNVLVWNELQGESHD